MRRTLRRTNMWRTLILVLLVNCSNPDKYEFLPEIEEGTAGLPVDKIIPQENYEYWEYRFSDFSKDEVLCSGGVSLLKDSIKFDNQTSGMFTECDPGLCIFYVMAVKNGKMEIMDSSD